MSAAFWIFRMESNWLRMQARVKPVLGSFAAQWCPELGSETLVYPAMMMGWKSACDVSQHAHQPPAGAGLAADTEVRRDHGFGPAGFACDHLPRWNVACRAPCSSPASRSGHHVARSGRSVGDLESVEIPSQAKKGCPSFRRMENVGESLWHWRDQRTLGAYWVVLRCHSPQPQRISDSGWQMVVVLSVPARSFLCILAIVVIYPVHVHKSRLLRL